MTRLNKRIDTAAQRATSPHELGELARDEAVEVRQAVARNPSTPADVLRSLLQDPRWEVRFGVTENPHPRARDIALADPDKDIRGLAAQRSDLDTASYERILNDPKHYVRERLADVVADPLVAAVLARDPHQTVRATIVHNPALTDPDVEMLARDPIAQVRVSAAASRRPSPETLTRLAGDRSAAVRWSVLVHNPERLDLAKLLLQDPNSTNRTQAQIQLENPRQFTRVLGDIILVH